MRPRHRRMSRDTWIPIRRRRTERSTAVLCARSRSPGLTTWGNTWRGLTGRSVIQHLELLPTFDVHFAFVSFSLWLRCFYFCYFPCEFGFGFRWFLQDVALVWWMDQSTSLSHHAWWRQLQSHVQLSNDCGQNDWEHQKDGISQRIYLCSKARSLPELFPEDHVYLPVSNITSSTWRTWRTGIS